MAYVRKTKNAAELSAARSAAAKSRRHCRGGRPAGSQKDPSQRAVPTRSLCIREPDYQALRKYAFLGEMTIAEAVHRVVKPLVEGRPELRPAGWVE